MKTVKKTAMLLVTLLLLGGVPDSLSDDVRRHIQGDGNGGPYR